MTNKPHFTTQDAWVFAALFDYEESRPVDLKAIISLGDALTVSIFELHELQQGFEKLQRSGLIKVAGDHICLTHLGLKIKEQISKGRGDRHSIVTNTAKRLNAEFSGLPLLDQSQIARCDFLNAENLERAYQQYICEEG